MGGLTAHMREAQVLSRSRQARLHRADRDAEDVGGFLAAEPLDAGEQQDPLVVGRKAAEGALQVAHLQVLALPCGQAQQVIAVLERDLRALARAAARLVAIDVVQDREQPGAQVRPRRGRCTVEVLVAERGAGIDRRRVVLLRTNPCAVAEVRSARPPWRRIPGWP